MRATSTGTVTVLLLLTVVVAMVMPSSPHHRQLVSSSSSTLSKRSSSAWLHHPAPLAWDLSYLLDVESLLDSKQNDETIDDATSSISPQNVVRLQIPVSLLGPIKPLFRDYFTGQPLTIPCETEIHHVPLKGDIILMVIYLSNRFSEILSPADSLINLQKKRSLKSYMLPHYLVKH